MVLYINFQLIENNGKKH